MNWLDAPIDRDWIIVTPLASLLIGVLIIHLVSRYARRDHRAQRGGRHRG
jgi:hypothetical protein